jgi:hypothetical protein
MVIALSERAQARESKGTEFGLQAGCNAFLSSDHHYKNALKLVPGLPRDRFPN